jgi:hypothetical protein
LAVKSKTRDLDIHLNPRRQNDPMVIPRMSLIGPERQISMSALMSAIEG